MGNPEDPLRAEEIFRRGAICVFTVIIDDKEKIVLFPVGDEDRQKQEGYFNLPTTQLVPVTAQMWCTISGGSEPQDQFNLFETILREIFEEGGLKADRSRLTKINYGLPIMQVSSSKDAPEDRQKTHIFLADIFHYQLNQEEFAFLCLQHQVTTMTKEKFIKLMKKNKQSVRPASVAAIMDYLKKSDDKKILSILLQKLLFFCLRLKNPTFPCIIAS